MPTVQALRRHGGSRGLDLKVGRRGDRIDIELPADYSLNLSGQIAVRPRHLKTLGGRRSGGFEAA